MTWRVSPWREEQEARLNRVEERFVEVLEGLGVVEDEAEALATRQENACQRNRDELKWLHNDWVNVFRVNVELANIFES